MQTEKDLTGFPPIDKLPECTIYDYLWENNKDHTDDIAIIYLGKKITYGELFDKISACEKSLCCCDNLDEYALPTHYKVHDVFSRAYQW